MVFSCSLQKWNTFKEHVQNVVHVLEPWAGSFKTIEGIHDNTVYNHRIKVAL